jgi:hypothetical protein
MTPAPLNADYTPCLTLSQSFQVISQHLRPLFISNPTLWEENQTGKELGLSWFCKELYYWERHQVSLELIFLIFKMQALN